MNKYLLTPKLIIPIAKFNDYKAPVSSFRTEVSYYRALASNAASGFAEGDILKKVDTVNEGTGAITSTAWSNVDEGTVLAAAPDLANDEAEALDSSRIVVGTSALVSVTDTAAGIPAASIPANANLAEVHVWDANVSITLDGTTPDASGNGTRQADGQHFELESKDEIEKMQAVRLAGSDARLFVTFYRQFDQND